MDNSLSIRDLVEIECPQQRIDLVRGWIGELGFHWLEVARVSPGRPGEPVQAWRALAPCVGPGCCDRPCGDDDPRDALALASPVPCVWDVQTLAYAAPCAAHLRAQGVASGLSCAVRSGGGPGAVVVTLTAGREGRDWMTDAVVARALLIACHVAAASPRHDAGSGSIHLEDAMSDTQRDILDCLRQGLGDKVIADRLGMTTHNVDYHLRRLRQRFGVRNRVQLAQAARDAN